ncbi:MAG: prepilin-type N-terminal cleavage/methylation domain-containing protein [Candidatus Zipacnadales bacterium]
MRLWLRQANWGFTLVEVLVVLAVMAVLAGLVWPVLGVARQKSWEAICGSNLHQTGLALEMYLQDHDEVFPVSYVANPGGPYISWREMIQPYLRDTAVLRCPAAEPRGEKMAELRPELRATYALNGWLAPPDLRALGGGNEAPVALSAIEKAAGTIMICDAGYNNSPVALDGEHYWVLGMQEQPLPTERHQEGANFCFVDGHIKKLPEPATRWPEFLWDLQ